MNKPIYPNKATCEICHKETYPTRACTCSERREDGTWIEKCPRCGGQEWSIPEWICDKCHWQDPTVANRKDGTWDISQCCKAEKYINKKGYSHCEKCKGLFTSYCAHDYQKEETIKCTKCGLPQPKKTPIECKCGDIGGHSVNCNFFQNKYLNVKVTIEPIPETKDNWEEEFEKLFDKMFKGCGIGFGKSQVWAKDFIHSLLANQKKELEYKIKEIWNYPCDCERKNILCLHNYDTMFSIINSIK